VHHRDGRREAGEEDRFFERGIAATDDGECLVAEEEAVTRPSRRCSDGMPSMRALAPVDTMTECARYSVSPTKTPNGEPEKSTRSASAVTNSAPNRSACSRNFIMSSGPRIPSGNPG
jgi:hypothetical protein